MDGRKIFFMPCTSENNFVPKLPQDKKINLIYICNPNNPTGTTLNKKGLQKFVDYAVEYNSVILYDGAYEKFIMSDDVPHSIYELPNAKKCAIEIRSFSKFAGFTGLRCGYSVVPNDLVCREVSVSLNELWTRRQSTATNGVSYIIQRGAEATFLPEAKEEYIANIKYYLENTKIMRESLQELGYQVYGGLDSPYLWTEIPNDLSSWDWFDYLLNKTGIVCVPGIGFYGDTELNSDDRDFMISSDLSNSRSHKDYFRLSAFATHEDVLEAINRIKTISQ